jgi:membrane associated rhomboid family serine protease
MMLSRISPSISIQLPVFTFSEQGYSRRFYDARRTPPCQGASGSVNAILICSILSAPFRTIYLNFIIPVPAIAIVSG